MVTVDDFLKRQPGNPRVPLPPRNVAPNVPPNVPSRDGSSGAPGHLSAPDERRAGAPSSPDPPPAVITDPEQLELEIDVDIQQVFWMAECMVDLMRLSPVPESCPRDRQRLCTFIAEKLHGQISALLPDLVTEMCRDFQGDMVQIIDDEDRMESRRTNLANARSAKLEKNRDRARRYADAAEHLNEVRQRAAERVCAPPDDDTCIPVTPTADHPANGQDETPRTDFDYDAVDDLAARYQAELHELAAIPESSRRGVDYAEYPLSLSLGFLLCSLSRPALRLARRFIPLPSDATIYRHYHHILDQQEDNLKCKSKLEQQIDLFMELSGVEPGDVVSVAVDAMSMSPDRSCLSAKASDYLFVYYAQPLARPKKCFALHVLREPSGQAGKGAQAMLDEICRALSQRNVVVRYVCSDGDPGYNKRHQEFFHKWYRAYLEGGLLAALRIFDGETMIPVTDILHLLKNFCNKVKNHPVTICPDEPDDVLTCEDLQSLFNLGSVLSDKSSIGRMRDSYPLRLFSLQNCVTCMEKGNDIALMYLLPWALIEMVVRNPDLNRLERLEKALVSFDLLMHYFDLSFLPRSDGITQRFNKSRTAAVTFAEDSVWPRILNFGLTLIDFIITADGEWSFSRLGTHCLENFFGFVRQNARADDRSITAFRIMARTNCVSLEMEKRGIRIAHHGRDNVGGVVIGYDPTGLGIVLIAAAEEFCRSLVVETGLDFMKEVPLHPRSQLQEYLRTWAESDTHHEKDQVYKADFTSQVANTRIASRNRQSHAKED
jgi:hypothetical protein